MTVCYIWEGPLHEFMTTPVLELSDGTFEQCCEECADENFPGWDEGEKSGMD
jgi:hypothetical protein